MLAHIYITPKPDILDPQGKAVANALLDLGYDEVKEVRVGKFMTLEFDPVPGRDPMPRLEEMCRRLLANVNVETFRIKLDERK